MSRQTTVVDVCVYHNTHMPRDVDVRRRKNRDHFKMGGWMYANKTLQLLRDERIRRSGS